MLLLLLIGCRETRPIPQPGLELDPEEACRRVVNRLAGVTAFNAEIGITFTMDGEERSASGALVVSRPDRIRMRIWGPLGVTVMDLLVKDGRATLYLPQEERAAVVTLENRKDENEVSPQIRALMLMDTLLDELRTADQEWQRDERGGESAVVLLDAGQPATRIVYDQATLLPIRREDLVRGVTVEYADYREGEHRFWPGTITVTEGEISVVVEVEEVAENPELNPAVFELELPEDTVVERP